MVASRALGLNRLVPGEDLELMDTNIQQRLGTHPLSSRRVRLAHSKCYLTNDELMNAYPCLLCTKQEEILLTKVQKCDGKRSLCNSSQWLCRRRCGFWFKTLALAVVQLCGLERIT